MVLNIKHGVELIDAAEASEILQVSRVHVSRLVRDKVLPAARLGKGHRPRLIFDRADVLALRDQRSAS